MFQRSFFAGALLALLVAPVEAQVGPGGVSTAQVCTRDYNGSLNLRSGPGRGYGRVTQMPNGSALVLNSRQRGGDGFDWWSVSYGNFRGWVRSDYVCNGSSGASISQPVSYQQTGQVCTRSGTGRLSLRTGPGTGYGKLTEIPNGNRIALVSGSQAPDGFYWWNANWGGMQGWVRSDYVCNVR